MSSLRHKTLDEVVVEELRRLEAPAAPPSPLPWRIKRHATTQKITIVAADGSNVGDLYATSRGEPQPQDANAALILDAVNRGQGFRAIFAQLDAHTPQKPSADNPTPTTEDTA